MLKSLDELAQHMGCARSTAWKRMHDAGIPCLKVDDTERRYFEVDEDFLAKWPDVIDEMRKKGYVTTSDIAKRTKTSSVNVASKLKAAGIHPDFRHPVTGRYMWKDRPELDEIVILRKRRIVDSAPDSPGEEAFTGLSKGYKGILKGNGLDILKQEREKKQWIGRKGRLVIEGHVVAEGIIESVSMCGVFFKGSNSKGDLNDLELCE